MLIQFTVDEVCRHVVWPGMNWKYHRLYSKKTLSNVQHAIKHDVAVNWCL